MVIAEAEVNGAVTVASTRPSEVTVTGIERTTRLGERMRRRREKALALGLCIACCNNYPVTGRRICVQCNLAAKARVSRARNRLKEKSRLEEALHIHEGAGTAAMDRCAYFEATGHFEKALAQQLTGEDEARLCKKMGYALSYGARPTRARPWFQRALDFYIRNESLYKDAASMMLC